jgi:hypothetical protein
MIFRSFGSCATRPSALSRQDGLRHARRPNATAFGFPQLLQAPLAKIDIRSKSRQCRLEQVTFSGGQGLIQAARRKFKAGTVAPLNI